MKPLCIMSLPEDLDQGLFGQIFYHVLQVLPYLYARRIFPRWQLRSLYYGDPPDRVTVPGVLDLAYDPPKGPYRTLTLTELRRRHAHVLGNNWIELNRLWNVYFRIPERVLARAEALLPAGRILGVHYRGTDKQTTSWDSNPISQTEYITLLRNFLANRNDFDLIFAATDEYSFVQQLQKSFSLPVVSLGEVGFHLSAAHTRSLAEKADRALLDCLLLSRCDCVVETSSALPSFAKLLNPELEIYRCAASKLFGKLYTDMPYFPVAHIPVLPVTGPESNAILQKTMEMDWTGQPQTQHFRRSFVASPRWPLNHKIFSTVETIGLDRVAGLLFRGHR